MKTLIGILVVLLTVGCSSGQDHGDGGLPDGDGGSDRGDTGYFPEGLTLRIPANFQLCNMNGLWNLLQLPYLKYRVSLPAGDFSLPLDQAEFAIDLVDRLEVSGQDEDAVATGPGRIRLWREDWGPGYPEYCSFSYQQPFEIDAGALDFYFGFYMECEEGATWELPDNLGAPMYVCGELASEDPGRVVATVPSGDRIEFDYHYYEGCARSVGAGICPDFQGDPSRGRFVRGAGERVQTEYFELALSCAHHGHPRTFLMVFDTPLEGVRGVVLDDDQARPAQVRYLDADLNTASTENVESIDYE